MEPLDQKLIWDAFLHDYEFNIEQIGGTVDTRFLSAIEPFIKNLPTILKDILNERVTIGTLFRAKMLFLTYGLRHGFAAVMTRSPFVLHQLAMASMLDNQLKLCEIIANRTPEFIARWSLKHPNDDDDPRSPEDRFMLEVGALMLVKNITKYLLGELLIGDLVASEPYLFISTRTELCTIA